MKLSLSPARVPARASLAMIILLCTGSPRVASAHGGDYGAGEIMYRLAAIGSLLLPAYSMTFDDSGVSPGLLWEVVLGGQPDGGRRHQADASVAYYPGSDLVVGRAAYRYSFFVSEDASLRVSAGVGGFITSVGGGPRVDLRIRYPYLVFLGLAYEPDLHNGVHGGELAVGLEIPF